MPDHRNAGLLQTSFRRVIADAFDVFISWIKSSRKVAGKHASTSAIRMLPVAPTQPGMGHDAGADLFAKKRFGLFGHGVSRRKRLAAVSADFATQLVTSPITILSVSAQGTL